MVAGRGNGTGTVDQVINRVVVCDGVPFGGGNLGDGDIFVSVCNGCSIAGFQGYFIGAVRVVLAPIYNGDGLARGRVVEGVVCFVDDGGIIFHFRDLAVVSDYAIAAASDGGWAGVDVVGVTTYRNSRFTNDFYIATRILNNITAAINICIAITNNFLTKRESMHLWKFIILTKQISLLFV